MYEKVQRRVIGSKAGSGVYQNIINIFPRHDIYIEGFLGSGSIMKHKQPAKIDMGFEINPLTIEKHKNQTDYKAYNIDTIIFMKQAAPLINYIHQHSNRILIYLDPPYPIHTRRSKRKIYSYEFDDEDHIKFLDAAIGLKCYVVISSYKNHIYDLWLLDSGWKYYQFQTTTRQGKATETVYYNFPDDLEKHEYTYLGKNFRERAAIKNRVKRNASKIMRMSPGERLALFDLLGKMCKDVRE